MLGKRCYASTGLALCALRSEMPRMLRASPCTHLTTDCASQLALVAKPSAYLAYATAASAGRRPSQALLGRQVNAVPPAWPFVNHRAATGHPLAHTPCVARACTSFRPVAPDAPVGFRGRPDVAIIGSSFAGMLAAAALAEWCNVVVLERDALPPFDLSLADPSKYLEDARQRHGCAQYMHAVRASAFPKSVHRTTSASAGMAVFSRLEAVFWQCLATDMSAQRMRGKHTSAGHSWQRQLFGSVRLATGLLS